MTAPARNLARQVSGSAAWSYLGVFADRVIRFGVFVIVARLVDPAAFGAVVLSLLVVEVLQTVFDLGLSTALIQQSTLSKLQLDTVFFVIMTISCSCAALLLFGAPRLTGLVHEGDAAPLLRALAAMPVINGLGAVHLALIERDLGFKALAGRTVASSVVASAVAVLLAFAGFGAWALVARTLLLAGCGTVAAWLVSPFRPGLRCDLRSLRAVGWSGVRLWAAGVAGQVNARGFDFLAGVVLGATALGALRIAGQMVLLMIEMTVGPLTAVGYALLSRSRQDAALFEDTLVTLAGFAALLIFPAFAGLYVVADPLLPLLFGARWAPAAALTPYMCAIAPALYCQLLISTALFASGRSDRLLQWALIEAAATAVAGCAGARYGLVGLAAAATLRLYLMMPLGWRWLERDVGVSPRVLAAPALRSGAAAIVMAAVMAWAKAALGALLAPAPLIAAVVAIGLVTYAALLPFSARRLLALLLERTPLASPVS